MFTQHCDQWYVYTIICTCSLYIIYTAYIYIYILYIHIYTECIYIYIYSIYIYIYNSLYTIYIQYMLNQSCWILQEPKRPPRPRRESASQLWSSENPSNFTGFPMINGHKGHKNRGWGHHFCGWKNPSSVWNLQCLLIQSPSRFRCLDKLSQQTAEEFPILAHRP